MADSLVVRHPSTTTRGRRGRTPTHGWCSNVYQMFHATRALLRHSFRPDFARNERELLLP